MITSHKIKEKIFFKFILAGILNTLFGYAFYAMLVFIKVDVFFSLFIATIAGILFNYLTFAKLVFKSSKNFFTPMKFIFTYFFSYIINVCLLKITMDVFINNPFVAQIISLPFVVLFNWISMNYWVFKNEQK